MSRFPLFPGFPLCFPAPMANRATRTRTITGLFPVFPLFPLSETLPPLDSAVHHG